MALGLLIANLLSWVGLVAAAVYGHRLAETHHFALRHVTIALPAALLSMFSHCMTFFYFIGMTKQVKDWCAQHNINPDVLRKMRSFKAGVSPYITLAIMTTMAATIWGGGAATSRGVHATIHAVLAYTALGANLLALYMEYKYLLANNLVVEETLRIVTGNKS